MVAGSLSSSYYGKPRSTQDVDIIIDPEHDRLLSFLNLLGPEHYVSRVAAMDALKHRGMFNVIDTRYGWKVDLIIRKARPFSVEEFGRRRPAELMGVHSWILSPEDCVLSKLEWTKGRDSTLQLQDAIQVLIMQGDKIDFSYLKRWAHELGVVQELEDLMEQARKRKSS
jgi:hypothetical protein